MWKHWRRKKLLNAPFPPAWRDVLEARVPIFSRLPDADRRELEGLVQVLIGEKNFEGCGGLIITDEIKVCIAAQACLLLLHRNTDYYPGLRSILVYPSKYYTQTIRHLGGGVMEERRDVRLGEAWDRGSVVLAWDAVLAGMADPETGTNVVLHEFAHLLDYEDGYTNGTPLLDEANPQSAGKTRRSSWAETLSAEFERLRAKAEQDEEIYLNVYGTTNPAEFFAVATEFFFEFPHEMKSESPKIYDELKQFYLQDPSQWAPVSQRPPNVHACLSRASAKKAQGNLAGAFEEYTKALEIKGDSAQAYLGLGSIKQAQGDLSGALSDYDRAILLKPNDAGLYVYRGSLKKEMLELDGALADFTVAIGLDPDYSNAFCHRGFISQAKGNLKDALADYVKAIESDPENGWGYFGRGSVRYNSREFADALIDFRKASGLLRGLNYGDCFIWLIRARVGDRDAATRELQASLDNGGAAKQDEWIANVARFLLGNLTEPDFFKTATNSNDKKDRRQQCHTLFFAGTKRIIDGDKTTAMEFFEKCLAKGKVYFAFCQSAAAELQFLKTGL